MTRFIFLSLYTWIVILFIILSVKSELIHWKRPWCWERLRARGEGDDRGWDDWMASPTQWTWVWVDSGSWWWTGRPSVLQFVGSQRVGHDWATELNWDSILRSRDITLPTKVRLVKAMVFPVVMYGCESWTIKEAECRRIDVFELWCWRRLLSPLDCKEIQPVHPKGDQSWILFGRTDAEAETPILWSPDVKNWLIWKDPDAGKDWRQEEKGATEVEMARWHHWLNGREFE